MVVLPVVFEIFLSFLEPFRKKSSAFDPYVSTLPFFLRFSRFVFKVARFVAKETLSYHAKEKNQFLYFTGWIVEYSSRICAS